MKQTTHEFKSNGFVATCFICHRLESDSIHTVIPDHVSIIHCTEPAMDKSNISPDTDISNVIETLDSFEVFKPILNKDDDPGEVPSSDFFSVLEKPPTEIPTEIPAQINEQFATANCKGHKCDDCEETYYHTYDCNNKKRVSLCEKCAGQSSVLIHRPEAILQMQNDQTKILSGAEQASLLLEHEEFVVHNLIYDTQGNEYPDWMEKISAHRQDIKRNIEKWNIKAIATSKAVMRKNLEDVIKLSKEDREEYAKLAAKGISFKVAKEKKESKTEKEREKSDPKAQYNKMIKDITASIKYERKNKNLPDLDDQAMLAKAEKRYKVLNEEENL